MRITGLVESLDHVCFRYRLRAFAPALADHGHALELTPLPRTWWDRLLIGRSLGELDAVVVQRKLLAELESRLLRQRVRKIIYDFDDAVWLRDSYDRRGFVSRKLLRRFRAILRRSDAVVAGNSYLAEQATKAARGCPVQIIPTCVDVDRYPRAQHDRPRGRATLVWVGSGSTLRGLSAVQPLLEQIGERCPGVDLKLICDRFFDLKNLRVVACPWYETFEAREIADADIGISWMPDDRWSRGKCGLKVLQYMAAGLPVIANPVGVQAEMVVHGETGFLASTDSEWIEAVRLLADDPGLRRRMGRAGRELVEERYSVQVGARLWAALLGEVRQERIPA